jgi:glucosamine--fructose-6-phosphate aminotransferase (isomerizing)
VVHNGIVENYPELKAELTGHISTSETNTEVTAHLLEEALEDDLPAAVEAIVNRLEGSFAIGVVANRYDGFVAVRQDSPLVVGHSGEGNFIASDVMAFLEHTRLVTYLEDGDVAHVTDDGKPSTSMAKW